jgi:lipopolysaccharide/colanic/teichoic acid biosynthesis glycosyltransferase
MSLVGPRPDNPISYERYSEEEKKAVFSVRPGITDYGSLRFHDEGKFLVGDEDPVEIYFQTIKEEKLMLQLKYIEERSVWVDIKIIMLTLMTIIRTRLLIDDIRV